MQVRDPVFAHQGWYPLDERVCRQAIDGYFHDLPDIPKGNLAGIVPHAGWTYSGRTAAKTFSALRDAEPEVVFLFGGHMHPDHRCVCMPEGAFGTPLGPIEVHEDMAKELVKEFDCDQETPSRFVPDNTIELQLPFIKALWPKAQVVAIGVPPRSTAQEMGVFASDLAVRHVKRSLAIGSTDLTHYGQNYGFMPQGTGEEAHRWSKEENDRTFLDYLLSLDGQLAMQHALANQSACCAGAAAAAVSFAKACGAERGQLIEHTTSHEVEGRGKPSMWVGYAAIVF